MKVTSREVLLAIAREAIAATVAGRSAGRYDVPDELTMHCGAFVSLHMRGELRGCIGRLEADMPLVQTVEECARLACTADPRFPAVSAGELAHVAVEISVLGPMERVQSLGEIVIGRDGLVVEGRDRRGVLLPQVATAYGWTSEVFVEQTCRKAGLPRDSWKADAIVWRFEAEVFGEG
jgi:AmmeMemoRadiSam system protein A